MSFLSKTIAGLIFFLFSIACIQAQSYNYKDQEKENPQKYLTGAVPEVGGKVLFSETIHTNLNADQIAQVITQWIGDKQGTNKNFYTNKVIYNDTLKRELAVIVNDRLVFTSSAFSLDYATINYYIIIDFDNGRCNITVKNIKYKYGEFKEQVTANEMISDEVALNEEKTKMYRINDKFRIATVDMVDNIFDELDQSLNKDEYDTFKNVSKSRREINNATTVAVAVPIVSKADVPTTVSVAVTPQTTVPKAQETAAIQQAPLVTHQPTDNSQVLAIQATIEGLAKQKAFAFTNFFLVGENIAYVKQLTAMSVMEIEAKATIACYFNNEGAVLSQSQIMPSGKFKILYYTPNYGSYSQLVELSRKYKNGEPYTDADINMIEVLLENSPDALRVNHLKIETVLSNTVSNLPTIPNMPPVGTFIKTDKCVVITGNKID